MPIEWPEQLKSDLRRKKVAVVLGGGVSKNAVGRRGGGRPPLWEELLQHGLERLGRPSRYISAAIRGKDYLHACEWLRAELDEVWVTFLREQLVAPLYEAAEIHRNIFLLDQRIYLNLNFDHIFENYVTGETGGEVQIKSFYDLDAHKFLRDDQQYIIKLHGSVNNMEQMIFTQRDYAEARVRHASFYEALDACLLSHTFLFIGCGVSDPDINLMLENQRFNFPHTRPHYLVTSSKLPDVMRRSLRANRNLKTITYNPANHHQALTDGLKELVQILDL